MGWQIFQASYRDRQLAVGLDGLYRGPRTSEGVKAAAEFFGYRAGSRLVQMIEHLEVLEQEIEAKEGEAARKLAEQSRELNRRVE